MNFDQDKRRKPMPSERPRQMLNRPWLAAVCLTAIVGSSTAGDVVDPQDLRKCVFECGSEGYEIGAREEAVSTRYWRIWANPTKRKEYTGSDRMVAIRDRHSLAMSATLMERDADATDGFCDYEGFVLTGKVWLVSYPNPTPIKAGAEKYGSTNPCTSGTKDIHELVRWYNSRQPASRRLPHCRSQPSCVTIEVPESDDDPFGDWPDFPDVPEPVREDAPLGDGVLIGGDHRHYVFDPETDAPRASGGHGTDVGSPPMKSGEWTDWLNRDGPAGAGDYETLRDFVSAGEVCPEPVDIECRAADGTSWAETGQVVRCDLDSGCYCRNDDQPAGEECFDYRVRFLCRSADRKSHEE